MTLVFYWAARIIAAVIMFQTLYFKFSGAEESVYIFTAVGMEPCPNSKTRNYLILLNGFY